MNLENYGEILTMIFIMWGVFLFIISFTLFVVYFVIAFFVDLYRERRRAKRGY